MSVPSTRIAALLRRDNPREQAEEGGLPASRRPDQQEPLAFGKDEVIDRQPEAVAAGQANRTPDIVTISGGRRPALQP